MMYIFGLGSLVDTFISAIDRNPWQAHAGTRPAARPTGGKTFQNRSRPAIRSPLYTPEQRERRDKSRWTLVQGILAPLQFGVFLISLVLVLQFLATGDGYALATASIIAKTAVLYAIMVTGAIWEREVFGKYLFARPFFWEDVVSMVVMALHTAYVVALLTGALGANALMLLALAAYAAYVINAAQFLIKFRAARRDSPAPTGAIGAM